MIWIKHRVYVNFYCTDQINVGTYQMTNFISIWQTRKSQLYVFNDAFQLKSRNSELLLFDGIVISENMSWDIAIRKEYYYG